MVGKQFLVITVGLNLAYNSYKAEGQRERLNLFTFLSETNVMD